MILIRFEPPSCSVYDRLGLFNVAITRMRSSFDQFYLKDLQIGEGLYQK